VPLGYIFRNTLEPRGRRSRRMGVCLFLLCALLVIGLGRDAWRFLFVAPGVAYYFFGSMLVQLFSSRRRPNAGAFHTSVIAGSLDERAYLRYGREYDQLSEPQQREMLNRYRVGNYRFPLKPKSIPEEIFLDGKANARSDAYRILLWAAPLSALLYAVVWFLRPAWAYWPTFLFVAAVTACYFPHLLWTWRQPDLRANQRFDLPEWV
jgi:predicted membrane channel-forming protein YqfA (hemolysin III family)